MQEQPHPPPLTQRLLWFAALWLGGVGAVTLLSYGLRLYCAEMTALRQLTATAPSGKLVAFPVA